MEEKQKKKVELGSIEEVAYESSEKISVDDFDIESIIDDTRACPFSPW